MCQVSHASEGTLERNGVRLWMAVVLPMKIIEEGRTDWYDEGQCDACGTVYGVDETDLEYDHFKPAGTYWFDGSAGEGIGRYFVKCPRCRRLRFIDPADVPLLVLQDAEARAK